LDDQLFDTEEEVMSLQKNSSWLRRRLMMLLHFYRIERLETMKTGEG